MIFFYTIVIVQNTENGIYRFFAFFKSSFNRKTVMFLFEHFEQEGKENFKNQSKNCKRSPRSQDAPLTRRYQMFVSM